MSYFVIKGPAENGQYLGPTVCDGTDFGCPQWRGTRADGCRFPDEDSAWKFLDLVQKKHPDAWYQGRVVRVNTIRDRLAEYARLRQDNENLRCHITLKEMLMKSYQAEIERLKAPLLPGTEGETKC